MFQKQSYPKEPAPPSPSGTLNGKPFTSIRDADPEIGARLELYAAGAYLWIPFQHIASMQMEAPKSLRDTLWASAFVMTGPDFKGTDIGRGDPSRDLPVFLEIRRPVALARPDHRMGTATTRGTNSRSARRCTSWMARKCRCWKSGRWSSLPMPLRDEVLKPIPGENPGGQNLRYAPVYEKIKEARREDDELSQGAWQHERKVADNVQVIKLTEEALATQSKDLWLAAWLSEALLKKNGFGAFLEGLQICSGLVATFWDHLYPELDEGDAELRAAPLEWVANKLDIPIKSNALCRDGYNFYEYKDSRALGYEDDAKTKEQKAAREKALKEGKLAAEVFDKSFTETPKAFYFQAEKNLDGCLAATAELGQDLRREVRRRIPLLPTPDRGPHRSPACGPRPASEEAGDRTGSCGRGAARPGGRRRAGGRGRDAGNGRSGGSRRIHRLHRRACRRRIRGQTRSRGQRGHRRRRAAPPRPLQPRALPDAARHAMGRIARVPPTPSCWLPLPPSTASRSRPWPARSAGPNCSPPPKP